MLLSQWVYLTNPSFFHQSRSSRTGVSSARGTAHPLKLVLTTLANSHALRNFVTEKQYFGANQVILKSFSAMSPHEIETRTQISCQLSDFLESQILSLDHGYYTNGLTPNTFWSLFNNL